MKSVDWSLHAPVAESLWALGWSAKRIATKIPSATKSAVNGRLFRAGLTCRDREGSARQERALARYVRNKMR